MSVDSYELVTVEGDYVTVDLIIWRRYRSLAFGMTERMLDDNPHLAKIHRLSPFIPPGTQVRVPIDPDLLKGTPQPKTLVKFYDTPQITSQQL